MLALHQACQSHFLIAAALFDLRHWLIYAVDLLLVCADLLLWIS
jgi:hypothetical protein